MKLKFLIALSCLMALYGFSCNKDKDEQKGSSSLIQGEWKMAHDVVVPFDGSTPAIDRFQNKQPCERDDIYRFLSDGTLQGDQGATKCSPGESQTLSIRSWYFLYNDDTQLRINDGMGGEEQVNVNKLDSDSLVYSDFYLGLDGKNYWNTVSYSRR